MGERRWQRLLDDFRPEVDEIIRNLRPTLEPLPVKSIAAMLNVELHSHSFSGPVRGAALADRAIILDTRLRGHQRAEVFGHEVAHILQRRGYFRGLGASDVELFADQFARELLLPLPWLLCSVDSPLSLARRLRVSGRILALQLALAGEAPELMRDGDIVLCPTCGSEPLAPICHCRPYRRDPRQRQRLADYRALPVFCPPQDGQLRFEVRHQLGQEYELAVERVI